MSTAHPAKLQQESLLSILCALLLLSLLLVSAGTEAADISAGYSIVLASAPGKNRQWGKVAGQLTANRTLYVEQTTIKGSPWERLCLGFFETRIQANTVLKEVRKSYPGAWLQKSSRPARIISAATAASHAIPEDPSLLKQQGNTSTLTGEQLDSLMRRAKTDFKNKKYSSSIRYLNALTAAGNHKYSQEALELTGLARQRKGQKTHAVSSYEKYLERYPDGEGANRVRQRLAGLLTETSAPRKKIHMASPEGEDRLISYGSLSQFYQSNSATLDDGASVSTMSQLITFMDLTSIYKTLDYDHRFQFTSDHIYDFIDDNDSSEFRFVETYYELAYRNTGTSGRFGRQRLLVGGYLKRFDGLSGGYQFNPEMRLNFMAGFPVDTENKSSINSDKTFYGFTFETGTFLRHWSMNLFYFDQEVNGLTDLNSIGSEIRFRDSSKALYGLIDYDLFYDEINILQLNGNIFFNRGSTVFINATMRKAPLLTTSNALIGRQEQSIEELKSVLNIEQIYQLARDRTANNETLTLGGAQPISEKYSVAVDITSTHTDSTVASGGVPETSDTGTNFYINTQLVGNNLLMKNDTNILGIRYYETSAYGITSFIANARFPISRKWRINPRLQLDFRKYSDARLQKKLRAILRADYRFLRSARFDAEIGYDQIDDETNGQYLASSNLFFTLGYRWDF